MQSREFQKYKSTITLPNKKQGLLRGHILPQHHAQLILPWLHWAKRQWWDGNNDEVITIRKHWGHFYVSDNQESLRDLAAWGHQYQKLSEEEET